MDIMLVVNRMIQLFVMIGVGFVVARANLIQENFNQHLTKFVLNLTMPCMIISSVISSQSHQLALRDIMLSTILLVFILPLFAYLCIRLLSLKKHQGLYMFMMMYPNVGFIGFPLLQSIFGVESILSTAVINMGFNLSLFTLGIIVMTYGQNRYKKFTISWSDFFLISYIYICIKNRNATSDSESHITYWQYDNTTSYDNYWKYIICIQIERYF